MRRRRILLTTAIATVSAVMVGLLLFNPNRFWEGEGIESDRLDQVGVARSALDAPGPSRSAPPENGMSPSATIPLPMDSLDRLAPTDRVRPEFEHSFLDLAEVLFQREVNLPSGELIRRTVARVEQFPRPVWIEERYASASSPHPLGIARIEVFDEWIVRTDRDDFLRAAQGRLGFEIESGIPDLGLWTVRALALDWSERADFEERLASLEGILKIIPNDIIWPTETPNDPAYEDHWQLKNVNPEPGWNYLKEAAINDRVSVTAAVIDTGVNFSGSDILPWVNEGEIPGNGKDDDRNGKVDDINGWDFYMRSNEVTRTSGHGVNVGRIAGSIGNNGTGNVSASWRLPLMAGICFSSNGAGSLNSAVDAIYYATQNGARVINCSFIGGSSWAFSYVFSVAQNLNVIVVAGSGNNGINLEETPMYPVASTFANVVGVGAATAADVRAGYSNYGAAHVEVFAPASGGTSYAAPMATSIVALLIADDPEAPFERIIDRLVKGSDPIPALAGLSLSDGRLNLTNSLRLNALRRPYGLQAQALTASSNRLTWVDQATAETGFIIERSETDPNSVRDPDDSTQMEWRTIDRGVPANQTFFDDVGLVPGRTYYYRVRAKGAGYNSARNPETRVTVSPGDAPDTAPPEDPVASISALGGEEAITLEWDDGCANESRFVVERSHDGGQIFYEIAWLNEGVERFVDAEVVENQSYHYRLKTETRGSGVLTAAIAVTAAQTELEVILEPASGLSVVALSASSTELNWFDRSLGESGYSVERRLGEGNYVPIVTLPADASSFTDTGLAPESRYQYRVRVSGGTESEVSAAIAVSTPALPAVLVAPNLVVASAGTTTVNLNWTDQSERQTGYSVERKTGDDWSRVGSSLADASSFQVGSLSPATSYQFRIRVGDGVTWVSSNTVDVTTASEPAILVAPSDLSAVASPTSVILSWADRSERETGYVVERRSAGSFVVVASLGADSTAYEDADLTPETAYEYRIRVSDGNADRVSVVIGIETAALPAVLVAPELSARAIAPTSVRLTWNDASMRESGYIVERSAGGPFSVVANLEPGSIEYHDPSVLAESSYQYRVRVTDGVASVLSGVVSVQTPIEPSVLVAPVITATVSGDVSVRLEWNDESESELGYRVERDAGNGFTLIAELSADSTSFLDAGLSPGASVQYRVSVIGNGAPGGGRYRYLRWSITGRRGAANSVQVSEFEVWGASGQVTIAEATNPSGVNPARELPEKLIDGSVSSKWLDLNFSSDTESTSGQSVVVFDLGGAVPFDRYRWFTANDINLRDPVSWKLEASTEGISWTLLDAVDGGVVTEERRALVPDRPVLGSVRSPETKVSNAVVAHTRTELESWRSRYFGAEASEGMAADESDPDGDGWSNLEEFATLRAPDAPHASLTETGLSEGGMLTLEFRRRWNPTVRYRVQGVEALPSGAWQDLAVLEAGSDQWEVREAGVEVEESGTGEGRAVKIVDRPSTGARYLRLVIEQPE